MDFSEQFFIILNYLYQGGYTIIPLIIVSVWMWYLIVKKFYDLTYWKKQRGRNAHEISILIKEFEDQKTFDIKIDKKLLRSLVKKRQNNIEKHIQTIFVLAAIAPLLGLLGTVTGMITTFDAISRFGTSNARAMASGISEALITTQTGLIVAVPGLFMGYIIRKKIDDMKNEMDRFFFRMEQRFFKKYETKETI